MELLYQYIWKYRLCGNTHQSVDGRKVEISFPGVLNTGSGPDFTGARVKIDGDDLAGNVEIHVRASDWYRHSHEKDKAYDSVVLHVVGVNDMLVRDSSGRELPQIVVTFPEAFARMYSRLAEKIESVPCEPYLHQLTPLAIADWVSALAMERLQSKASRILEVLEAQNGDWNQTCFIALARALGFGLNGEPFERVAKSLPLRIIYHHADNPLQVEALVFGQAGMLDSSQHIFDEYYQMLCREYFFLARKYGLRPLRRDVWRFARTRPQNFPHRRLAMLSRVLCGDIPLLQRLLSAAKDDASSLFHWKLEGYWGSHFDFDTEAHASGGALSEESIRLLMINFVAPMLYAYSSACGDCEIGDKGVEIWETLPRERNSIITQWMRSGLPCESAFESQALLHLRKQYCDMSRCLQCRFGLALLRTTT